jgi:hypothetical protein
LGVDLSSYIKHARESLTTIDSLIKKRESLIAREPEAQTAEALRRENLLLQDIRDCCADDLEEAYVRAKRVRASLYFQYLWVATSNTLGGGGTLANNIANIKNLSPHAGWPGGVGDMLSGSMNMITPEAVNYAGRAGAHLAGNPLTAEISTSAKKSAIMKLDTDLESLRATTAPAPYGVYQIERTILAQHFSSRPKPLKGTVGRVVGDFGAAAGGGGKLTNGIEVLVGNYKDPTNAHKRFDAFGGGGIAYGTGVAIAEEETLRREFLSELRWHKLPKAKRQSEILKTQLAELDRARAELHSSP